jgi:hypothetical protein
VTDLLFLAAALVLICVLYIWPVFKARELMRLKSRSGAAGVVLGLLLGWIGVLVTLAFRDHSKRLSHAGDARPRRPPARIDFPDEGR